MKVFESRNILCTARLHYAADVLLYSAARCNYDKSGSASCAARLTSLLLISIGIVLFFEAILSVYCSFHLYRI